MTISQLQQQLQQLGVPSNAYCLTGGLPNEAYTLNPLVDKWETYYSERGNKNKYTVFSNEPDACQQLFVLITDDSLIRRMLASGTK